MPNDWRVSSRCRSLDTAVLPVLRRLSAIVRHVARHGAQVCTQKVYVVQTIDRVIERCLLMTTDPGDLVLDPTCGSGTTAYVAEQWGRRWITCDTSRVALALARTRLMAAKYPYYLLADSPEGIKKESELTGKMPPPNTRRKTTSARASSTSACRTSRSRSHRQQPGHQGRHDAAGDRRGHRPACRDRNALRPALRGQEARARERAVHRRKPLARIARISVEEKKQHPRSARDGWKMKVIGPDSSPR